MTAGITPTEVLDTPSGATIRMSRSEDVQRCLEWHGFQMAEVRGPFISYRRENRSGAIAAPEPIAPPVIPVH